MLTRKTVVERRREECRGRRKEAQTLSGGSPVLVDLGIPAFFQFLLRGGLALRCSDLHLYALACAQNLALQVETATLLRIVDVEELLESFHNVFDVLLAGRRGLDVEDFAGLVEGQAGGGEATAAILLRSIFSGGLGLLVGLGEGAAEDPGSGDDDLGDNAVSLERVWVRIFLINSKMCIIGRKSVMTTYHVDGLEGAGAMITRR